MAPRTLHLRGKVAALARSRQPNDPELIEARRSIKVAYLAKAMEDNLARGVDLTNDERAELLSLLIANGGEKR